MKSLYSHAGKYSGIRVVNQFQARKASLISNVKILIGSEKIEQRQLSCVTYRATMHIILSPTSSMESAELGLSSERNFFFQEHVYLIVSLIYSFYLFIFYQSIAEIISLNTTHFILNKYSYFMECTIKNNYYFQCKFLAYIGSDYVIRQITGL